VSDTDSIVFIVDDDALVRTSFVNLCRSVDLNVQAFASPDEFLKAKLPDVPACLILDVRFPGSAPSGLDFQRTLTTSKNPLPIIFMTGHGDVPMSVQAMKGGAVDFLAKPVREQELLDAIRQGIERDRRRRERDAMLASLRERFATLTARERRIMHLVASGLLNKQIADELGLSEVTVKAHRGQVMHKMAAKSVPDLVRMSDLLAEVDATGASADTNV
jgi:FixJ family two-component response regulator